MDGQDESSNVEDVRGMRGGGGGGFGIGGRGIGLGTVAVAVIAGWIFGINPLTLLGMMGGGEAPTAQTAPQGPAPAPPANDAQARFVSQVLKSTEVVWTDVFKQAGRTYQPPRLVLFSDRWPTACGQGQAAMGPFYCPNDQKVYIDLRFYNVLERKLGAPGQFAQAYVVAHEVGHHVQQQLGVMDKVDAARSRGGEAQSNALSVRVELQADCLAGVWGHSAAQRKLLEPGDLEEGLGAAASVGDDRIQQKTSGRVDPESWTHGSAAARQKWFRVGFDSGDPAACDTFKA